VEIHSPTVSIVIPTYNRAQMLERSIKSVLDQTVTNLECIVVDDASDDDTRHVVEEIALVDTRLRYHRLDAHRYSSGARNIGTMLARGRYIAYLDDDDEWFLTKLEKQLSLFQYLSSDYGCVYCWADYFNSDEQLQRQHRPSLRGYVYSETLADNFIGCTPSLLIRREVAEEVGLWNESLRTGEDNEYIIRLCRICKVDFVPEVLVKVHTGHNGPQVSRPLGEDGVQLYLESAKACYELFRNERWKYKKQAAALEARMGNLYWRLGNRGACIEHFKEAFKLAPLTWEPYQMMLSMMNWQFRKFVGNHMNK
jgi:glycosyltransferase involved in cell wall biosynthesis